MSEKPPTSKTEEIPPTAEEIEREGIAECEAMMDDFEQMFNLEALHAITQFSSKEERESSPRQPALDALSLMFKRMKDLSDQGTLQRETRDALGRRYEKLSQAVGNIIGDKNGIIFDVVVHDRRTPFPGDTLTLNHTARASEA